MTGICSNVNMVNIDHLSQMRESMFLIGQFLMKISSFNLSASITCTFTNYHGSVEIYWGIKPETPIHRRRKRGCLPSFTTLGSDVRLKGLSACLPVFHGAPDSSRGTRRRALQDTRESNHRILGQVSKDTFDFNIYYLAK